MHNFYKSNYSMVFLLCAMLLSVLPDRAISKHRIGLKAGANYTWPYPKGPKPTSRSYPAGYFAGISLQVDRTKNLSLVSELLVIKGSQYVEYYNNSEEWDKNKFIYYSLLIPVMLKLKWFGAIQVSTGPTIGYLIRATCESNNISSPLKITQELPNFELNYAVGIGNEIQYQSCIISLELRYLIGLTRYRYKQYPWDWRNHSVQAGLNVYF